MSHFTIKDGTGTGKMAGVDNANRLKTKAKTNTEEHVVSLEIGNAYFASTVDTANTLTLATGNTYRMLYLKNDSSDTIVVEKVLSSSDTAGLVLFWTRNPTLGSVGANNVHVPANLNFSSNKTAVGTFHSWDETGTEGISGLSGGTVIQSFITDVGFTVHPIDGAIVIPQGSSMLLSMTNGTGGNVEAEVGVRFFYEDGT